MNAFEVSLLEDGRVKIDLPTPEQPWISSVSLTLDRALWFELRERVERMLPEGPL